MKRYLSTLLMAALTCLLGGNPLRSAEPRKVSAVEDAQNGEPIELLEFFGPSKRNASRCDSFRRMLPKRP